MTRKDSFSREPHPYAHVGSLRSRNPSLGCSALHLRSSSTAKDSLPPTSASLPPLNTLQLQPPTAKV